MRGVTSWLAAFLLGTLLGAAGSSWRHARQQSSDPMAAIVAERQSRAAAAHAAYAQQPESRERLVTYLDALLTVRDVGSVSRYPWGDDPERYQASAEVLGLLTQLEQQSRTPAARQQWLFYYVRAFGEPPPTAAE